MTDDDDSLLALYNRDLIALSNQVGCAKCLPAPDVKVTARSSICGSEIAMELCFDGDKIKDVGYTIEACSLTKAVMAIINRVAPGKNRQEICAAKASLQAMMDGGAVPEGDWAELKILAPVVGYKSRQETVMLPFDALEKAFAEKK